VRTIREGTRASGDRGPDETASLVAGEAGADRLDLERRLAYLTRDTGPLVHATTPAEVARAAAEVAARVASLLAAVWVAEEDSTSLTLAAVAGLRPERSPFRERWRHLPRRLLIGSRARARAAGELARACGVDHVAIRVAGPSVLVVGGARLASERVASSVAALLEAKLAQARVVVTARAETDRQDLALAWTAHELAGPLIAARAVLDQLCMTPAEDRPTEDGTLSQVARQLDELVQLCDGLLRWAVGASPPVSDSIDLRDVLDDAVASCRLEGRYHTIALDVPPEVHVRGDRQQLRIAVANLIRNALSYSPQGSIVAVGLEEQDGVATVSVEDQGPGVPEEERTQVFEPFIRGSVASPIRGGRGLGLFIARRVVEGHGGAIWVEPGTVGAAFRVQLPVAERAVESCASS
jgi:signal transduction histidine kinase